MAAHPNPLDFFAEWYEEAKRTEPRVPDAMQIATISPDGRPTLRTVLLKDFDAQGFVFYTNLGSRKARDLGNFPWAAATFHWKDTARQVHIEGRVDPVLDAEADAYFASRPRGSQIGAWASKQSQVLPERQTLVERVEKYTQLYDGREVPRPDFWSGFRIVPDRFEFWQDQPDRLHHRWRYIQAPHGWKIEELYP